jgi:hypothetical protein
MDKYTWKEIVLGLDAEIYERPYWLEDDYPEIYDYLEKNSLNFDIMKPFIDKEDNKQECLNLLVITLLDNGCLRDHHSELIIQLVKYLISNGAVLPEELLVKRKYETIVLDKENPFKVDKESFFKKDMNKIETFGLLPGLGNIAKNNPRYLSQYEEQCLEKEKQRISKGIMLLSEEIDFYRSKGVLIDMLGNNNLLTNKILKYVNWSSIEAKEFDYHKDNSDETVEIKRLTHLKFCSKFLSKNY